MVVPAPERAALPEHRGPLTRSLIDGCIDKAIEVFAAQPLHLPPFAFWTPEDWARKGREADGIRDCMLGWDVTDFGSGEFPRIGRTLFTLRNGRLGDPSYPKSYAEKYILDPEGQRAPAHFHRSKREDIINRGGGNILVQLTATTPDDGWSNDVLTIAVDGQAVRVPPRGIVRLRPGQSLTIPPRTIHQFWGEPGTGWTVSGEVSSVCDDLADNFFFGDLQRFPPIIEDRPRRHYLCHEYPRADD